MRGRGEREREALRVLAIGALPVALYLRVIGHPFVFLDDTVYVTANSVVQRGLTLRGVSWAFRSFEATNWHPLTWLSHMVDVELFGMWAGGHHLTSVALHAANGVLLYLVLRRMTGEAFRSGLVAALFAVHPLHVESVAWVAERKDVLSTLFWFLSMWSYARYVERPGAWRYLGVAAPFALGLMSKPMLVTLPFTLLLLDWWPLGRFPRFGAPGVSRSEALGAAWGLVREKIPLFALSAASSIVTYVVHDRASAIPSSTFFPLEVRLSNAAVSWAKYLGRILWPPSLATYYPHPGDTLPAWQVAGALVLLSYATVLFVRWLGARGYTAVGWLLGFAP